MKIYLDTSALAKLVQTEPESGALRRYLSAQLDDEHVSSAVARVELVRAVTGGGAEAVAHASALLSRLHLVALDRQLLDEAGALAPATVLRSLDALHLASALTLGADLRSVVTYDWRMQQSAADLGLAVAAPG